MFGAVGGQVLLWEATLPAELLRLLTELAAVGALLDDSALFAPFVLCFDPWMGRLSTPMETCLRLMFLEFWYRLGFGSLCREVGDSITWRRFCRIPLLAKAAEAKILLRTTRLRVETTVVPAKVSYPTDSSLLAKAVRRIAATGRRIQAAGGAIRTRSRDRSRSVGKRAHEIASRLRLRTAAGRDQAQAAVRWVTGELADLTELTPPRCATATDQRHAGLAPGTGQGHPTPRQRLA